ncbi:uncharacterized protein IUM83_18248 [Phytophthora cinnamomi]|uniref:uncharacterized protein n=1 Tax=Phytophthora cinnamomi TaxID=4785 RepID=UPI00355A78EC|nr:hypothetical protein IUM83_18248 [Phytophthora cinnamomi]
MKIIVLVPRTLLPPPSPPLAGERLPSSESALALLSLSSVMGVNFNTPFDEVASVGTEDDCEDADDNKLLSDDPFEFDATSLVSDASTLESSLELLLAVEPKALVASDPDLEAKSAVSDDDDDGKLLATALELELDFMLELADPASEEASDVDAMADPLTSDEDPDVVVAPADPEPDTDSLEEGLSLSVSMSALVTHSPSLILNLKKALQ